MIIHNTSLTYEALPTVYPLLEYAYFHVGDSHLYCFTSLLGVEEALVHSFYTKNES